MDSTAYALVLTTLPFAVFTFDEQYTNLNFGVFLRDCGEFGGGLIDIVALWIETIKKPSCGVSYSVSLRQCSLT